MSFMEHPQPDACRALMPTPESPPPGPPSRPIVCHMPKGHDETDGHAETRRPGPLTRRWHGDARAPVTDVDRPDNGQDTTGAGLMRNRCAFTSRDMAADWPEAFTYAVVFGWGDGDEDDAWSSVAAKFGWDEALVDFLRDAHRRFTKLADRADPGPQCPSTSHDTDGGWRCEHRAGHDPKVKHKNREEEW